MSPSNAMRRALARAERADALDVEEAAVLLAARGDDLERLCAVASRVRDLGLASAGREGVITYSRKVFIPLTRLCRDRCHYCTFVAPPSVLAARGEGMFLDRDAVLAIAREGAAAGCKEALFTLGDRPEDRWPEARTWLEERGYASTLDLVRAMAILVLEETGLLPHLNPGVMSWEEMHRLRPVAASMGLMLESSSRRLFEQPGQVHHASPDKDPAVRLRTIEDAGRLSIPFTTGVLLGIGEDVRERAESLFAIRHAAREFGHVREVIVQNFRAKPSTAAALRPDLTLEEHLAAIAVTRLVLGPSVRVQVPPNLNGLSDLPRMLAAGADDLGGISPVTPDHVNPERPWPHLDAVAQSCASVGLDLRERLAVHPEHVLSPDQWIDARLHRHVGALAGRDGLAADVMPQGLAWQEPDDDGGAYASFARRSPAGNVGLADALDGDEDVLRARGDAASVHGDWNAVGHRVQSIATTRIEGDLLAALGLAERDPSALAAEENEGAASLLMSATGDALDALCRIADEVRRDAVGDVVTYVVNRNINFTNVCYTGCRFCAFAQRRDDADAYTLDLDEVRQRVREAVSAGATEVCMQGGIHPDLPGDAYLDLARAVKAEAPGIHLHAFSPMEVVNGATRCGWSIRDFLVALRESGVDSLPGTAAEILDDEVRLVLTKGKLPTRTWLEVIGTAHEVGLRTTATMMYGHVDEPLHRVRHLRTVRGLQERTGGFTEFVPLPFVHRHAPLYLAGLARPGSTHDEDRAVHAMARLMLHGAIPHVQVSWVKLGDDAVVRMLASGADDLGGTLMEEVISRMAGSQHGSRRSVADLERLAGLAGRPSRQRTTLYGEVSGSPTRGMGSAGGQGAGRQGQGHDDTAPVLAVHR